MVRLTVCGFSHPEVPSRAFALKCFGRSALAPLSQQFPHAQRHVGNARGAVSYTRMLLQVAIPGSGLMNVKRSSCFLAGEGTRIIDGNGDGNSGELRERWQTSPDEMC